MATAQLPAGVPPTVRAALEALCAELRAAAGDALVSVVLYGGLARGRYRPGVSDVNVAVVLRDANGAALAAVAPALRTAWRAAGVDPFILGADELRGAARDFPTKLLDIRAHHVVLYGSDPFAEVQPSPEHVRLRVEQELRNLALRLRRRLVLAGDDRRGLAAAAANAVPPLAVNLGTLLELAGAGGEDAADGVFARAAEVFGLDGEALAAARAARDERSGELAPEMLQRLLDVALAAARTATMTTHGRA